MSIFGFVFGGEPPADTPTPKGMKPCVLCGRPIPESDVDGLCSACYDASAVEEGDESDE